MDDGPIDDDSSSSSFKQYGDDDDDDEETDADSILFPTDRIWWALSGLAVCAASALIFVWIRRRRGGAGGDSLASGDSQMNGNAARERGEAEEMEGLVGGEAEGKAGLGGSLAAWADGGRRWPWSWIRGRQRSQSYYALPTRNLDESRGGVELILENFDTYVGV